MLPASDRGPLWSGRRKPPPDFSYCSRGGARWRWRRGEFAVTPQPQASCPGGSRRGPHIPGPPPPLPTSPELPLLGFPRPPRNPDPPRLLLPRSEPLAQTSPRLPSKGQIPHTRSTCSFRIIAFEVKRGGISPSLLCSLAFATEKTRGPHTGTGLNPSSHSQLTQGCCYQSHLVSSHHALPSLETGHWKGSGTARSSRRPFSAFQRNQSFRYTEPAGGCQPPTLPPPPTFRKTKYSNFYPTTVLAFPTSRVRCPSPSTWGSVSTTVTSSAFSQDHQNLSCQGG